MGIFGATPNRMRCDASLQVARGKRHPLHVCECACEETEVGPKMQRRRLRFRRRASELSLGLVFFGLGGAGLAVEGVDGATNRRPVLLTKHLEGVLANQRGSENTADIGKWRGLSMARGDFFLKRS